MGDKLIRLTIEDVATLDAGERWQRFPNSIEYSNEEQFIFESLQEIMMELDGKGTQNIITDSQIAAADKVNKT